jgi:hypothetical protein
MLSQTSASTPDSFDFIVEMRLSRCLCASLSLILALCWKVSKLGNRKLLQLSDGEGSDG